MRGLEGAQCATRTERLVEARDRDEPQARGRFRWLRERARRSSVLFTEFDEDAVARWESKPDVQARGRSMAEKFRQWETERGTPRSPFGASVERRVVSLLRVASSSLGAAAPGEVHDVQHKPASVPSAHGAKPRAQRCVESRISTGCSRVSLQWLITRPGGTREVHGFGTPGCAVSAFCGPNNHR